MGTVWGGKGGVGTSEPAHPYNPSHSSSFVMPRILLLIIKDLAITGLSHGVLIELVFKHASIKLRFKFYAV